jgi:TorA maturation chaperone TorD
MSERERELQPAVVRDIYALCARLFATEVDAPLYEVLTREPTRSLLSSLGLMPEEMRGGSTPAEALEVLAVEYCRLFVGPQPACPPFASACRGEVLLGGRARTRLEEFLARNGLQPTEYLVRIASPDHAAVELAVLAQLHERAHAGAEEGGEAAETDRALREFLTGHVLPWMPEWLHGVEVQARHPVYRCAAQLGLALLEEERATHQL